MKLIFGLGFLALTAAAFAGEEAKVDQPAPDFEATGLDGNPFRLSDKLKSGDKNVVLLFSRANW